jgi:type I restriction enzyme S subunit
MTSKAEVTRLEKVLNFANGRTSPIRDDDLSIPVYGSNGLIGRASESNSSESTIVIGRVGSYCGSVHFSKESCWVTDNAIKATAKDGNDPFFLYYILKYLNLNNWRSGSGQPLLNQSTLNAIEALIPPYSVQLQISSFLYAIDDRIKLLQETNSTLESIAQALFKSWFVDFDPVRAKQEGRQLEGIDQATAELFPDSFEQSEFGEIPKGWTLEALDKNINFLNGLALQKFPPTGINDLPVIKIAQLRKGDAIGADLAASSIKPEYVVKDGDVLFSWSGSLEVEIWCGGEGALNQHLFKVTSSIYSKWFIYLWTRKHLNNFREIAASKATTMGHIQRSHLSAAKILVPDKRLLDAIDLIISPFINKVIENNLQLRSLSSLRDTLLPRLISGQLRPPDAEEKIEAATA